jgi:hypothetical protein
MVSLARAALGCDGAGRSCAVTGSRTRSCAVTGSSTASAQLRLTLHTSPSLPEGRHFLV